MISETFSDNLNFDIVVACIVLIGVLVVGFLREKKNPKETGVRVSLLALVFFVMTFFNITFIIYAFSEVPKTLLYILLGVSIIAVFFLLILLFSKSQKVKSINRKDLIVLSVCLLGGVPFYIIEQTFGLHSLVAENMIEVIFMLAVLMSLYHLVVSFLRKEGGNAL